MIGDILKQKIIKIVFIFILFITIYFISYTVTLKDLPKNIISILNRKYKNEKDNYKLDLVSIVVNNWNIKKSFNKTKNNISSSNKNEEVLFNNIEPIVYIYNTHSKEEYNYQKNNVYNIIPTVKEANYILESELKKLGINSIIETNDTIDILNMRSLPYSDSYKISRELLENKKLEYPSLIYFIDLHRDSVERKITTIEIDGKSYAKTMFLLGLENPNYEENKKVMNVLNTFLENNYKGLSRGIYEKKGRGVNGVYNQDFSSNAILIEVGGVGNTIDEVSNSLKAIANSLYSYIESNNMTKIE